MPFAEAAEMGTKKVINDHSTIGIVITTDGSIAEIPRDDYIDAEERVIRELKEISKPFVILLNTQQPFAPETDRLRAELAEKHLNMINTFLLAERLENMGAIVHLTRDTDVDISLQERVNISRRLKPDLFISLHINSVSETTNAENIRGFSVWHRNHNTIDISQVMLDVMYNINTGTNRHKTINQANLFVCRPAWVPSVLLEAGFIINIDDFVWLIDPEKQEKMADATVTAILEYFAG